jgi:valyl-tRNA synthetase
MRGCCRRYTHPYHRTQWYLAMSRLKPPSWLAQRVQEQRREYDRHVNQRREQFFDNLTGWMILRAVALGILFAVVLNVLIGYLATF